ncbi:LysR substrate-binding domain-containing protein [Acinetobacter sp. HC8-3S]
MDLRGLEHIRFPYGHQADLWTFRKNDQVEEVPVKARYSVTSSLAVRDALRAGFGVSLIPRPYVQQDLQTGVLQEVLQDWSTTEITQYAIYPSRQHLAPKIRVFIDFLVEQFKKWIVYNTIARIIFNIDKGLKRWRKQNVLSPPKLINSNVHQINPMLLQQ